MFSCCKKNKINDRNVIELKGIKIEEKIIIIIYILKNILKIIIKKNFEKWLDFSMFT